MDNDDGMIIGEETGDTASSVSIPENLRAYVTYLQKVEPLAGSQQVSMIQMVRNPEESEIARQWASKRLWLDTAKFVLYVRIKLRNSMPFVRLDDMDVIQEGNLAAGEALHNWDPAKGSLTTWLYPSIMGAMLDYAGVEAQVDRTSLSLDSIVGSEASSEALEGITSHDADDLMTLGEMLTYERHVFDDPVIITEYGQIRKLLIEQFGNKGCGDLAADFLVGETNVRDLAAKYKISVATVYNRMRKMGF